MKTNSTSCPTLFFLISMLAVSCQNDSDALNSTLSKVEACMDAHPDSALNLLKTIPEPERLHGKSQADYALLLTQAMDKNYLKFSSDSLIAVALNYYTVDQRDPVMRAKAQFYYGRVMLELGKQEDALKYFLAAKAFYDNTKEYKMMALISDEIGIINRVQKMYPNALINFQNSLSLYKEIDDSLCIVRAYQNIARTYLYKNKWDSCSLYFNRALRVAHDKRYNSEVSILHELGILYRSMGDLEKAEHYFLESYEKETSVEKKSMECLSIGFLYFQMEKFACAREYLKLGAKSSNLFTKIDVYDCLSKLEMLQGNFRLAIDYREKTDSINRIVNKLNSQSLIAELQKKYENEKLLKENLQITMRYTRFILIGTVAFMIVMFFMCYYYYKNRNNKRRIAEIEREFRGNEEEISRYQREIKEIFDSNKLQFEQNRNKIGELNGKIMILSTQNKTLSERLNKLGGEASLTVTSGHYMSTFRLLLAIKEGCYKEKISNEDRERLLELFDFLYLNYVSRLREKCSSLTKHDLEICCLLKMGLTHEELSRVFNTTSDSVTRAKGRLKRRLGISFGDDLECFLRKF